MAPDDPRLKGDAGGDEHDENDDNDAPGTR
jgi:hypothetical protein